MHHWAGLGDGSLTPQELAPRIHTDAMTERKLRIIKCEVLFIDEIGMISSKNLGMLEIVSVSQPQALRDYLECYGSLCNTPIPLREDCTTLYIGW